MVPPVSAGPSPSGSGSRSNGALYRSEETNDTYKDDAEFVGDESEDDGSEQPYELNFVQPSQEFSEHYTEPAFSSEANEEPPWEQRGSEKRRSDPRSELPDLEERPSKQLSEQLAQGSVEQRDDQASSEHYTEEQPSEEQASEEQQSEQHTERSLRCSEQRLDRLTEGCSEEACSEHDDFRGSRQGSKEHSDAAIQHSDEQSEQTKQHQEEDEATDVSESQAAPEWGDDQVAAAVALFEAGDFVAAHSVASRATANLHEKMEADNFKKPDEGSRASTPSNDSRASRPTAASSILGRRHRRRHSDASSAYSASNDEWRLALDDLATVYEEAGDADRAEALYLRTLAWREGIEQFREGMYKVSERLFKQSPEYKTVEDATWFLQNLKPTDGHAVSRVVGLLPLGEEVAAKAAVATWTLALRPEHRELIANCGGLELLAKATLDHPQNPELQAAGCGALRLLCKGNEQAMKNRQVLAEELGGIEILMTALRFHKSDPEVQREACGALQAICSKNPTVSLAVVGEEGIKLCLEAMVDCPDEAVGDTAGAMLRAMMCASEEDPESAQEGADIAQFVWEKKAEGLQWCKQKLKGKNPLSPQRHVVQALLGAMKAFIEDESVQHDVEDVVNPVLSIMQQHPGKLKVQMSGCGILLRLTEMSNQGLSTGPNLHLGIAALCNAMRDLPTNKDLQRIAVSALNNVVKGSNNNKTLGVKAGGMPLVINAMKRFPKDAKLQEQAIGTLTSLCDTLGRAATCAKIGGVDATIAAMQRHEKVEHISELGCVMLCMFCDDALLRQQVLRTGALEVAESLSRNGQGEAWKWGCELLRILNE